MDDRPIVEMAWWAPGRWSGRRIGRIRWTTRGGRHDRWRRGTEVDQETGDKRQEEMGGGRKDDHPGGSRR